MFEHCLGFLSICFLIVGQDLPAQEPLPVILIDDGHNNYGNAESARVMDEFLSENGFATRHLGGPISADSLDGVDIFHTDNALDPSNVDNWALPTPSAFTHDEISVLLNWVRDGGSLLVVIEHMPFGGSYEALATVLGFEVRNGFALDETRLGGYEPEIVSAAGDLLFRVGDGSLADHPVLDGSVPFGPIEHLATSTGSAFRPPEPALSLITLGPNVISLESGKSWVFDSQSTRISVTGWSQGAVMEYGDGRVAVLGDNFLITAPAFLEPPYSESESDAELGAHNHQFTLNLYRWLSRQAVR